MTLVKPLLQALLLADHVYTDATTGKKIVAGIFHTIYLRHDAPEPITKEDGTTDEGKVTIRVPAAGLQAGSPFCYASVTEVRGEQTFKLRFVDLDDDSVLLECEFPVTSSNPLEIHEQVIPLPMLQITRPGSYAMELLWNDEQIGSHRVNVVES